MELALKDNLAVQPGDSYWPASLAESSGCPPRRYLVIRGRRPPGLEGDTKTEFTKPLVLVLLRVMALSGDRMVVQLFFKHHERKHAFGDHALERVEHSCSAIEKKALAEQTI